MVMDDTENDRVRLKYDDMKMGKKIHWTIPKNCFGEFLFIRYIQDGSQGEKTTFYRWHPRIMIRGTRRMNIKYLIIS